MAAESGAVDYLEQSLRSIHEANSLLSGGTLEMNEALCTKVLGQELQVLEDFLLNNLERLLVKDLENERRRVALLHLYPVVKQTENLVRQCCETVDSPWPERVLSVFAMKEDVLDILVHLRWWTSILDIMIDSAKSWLPNSLSAEQIEAKRLESAGREFEDTLNLMALFNVMDSTSFDEAERKALVKNKLDMFNRIQEQINGLVYIGELGTKEHLEFILSWDPWEADSGISPASQAVMAERYYTQPFKNVLVRCIELHKAALEDKEHLVNKALDFMGSPFTGDVGSREHHAYLLANQVYSLLTDENIDGIPELNEWHFKHTVGEGTYGFVNRVTWCGLDCVLKQTLHDPDSPQQSDANALKGFSHPHIIKFYRHFVAHPGGDIKKYPLSHIVMERMPSDLRQHLSKTYRSASSSESGGARIPLPVAVDIMLQLAKAMWHMHSRSVVHRDLKPDNVLVEPVSEKELPELVAGGFVHVKLVDFGTVRENIRSSHSDLLLSYRAGTSLYRAPELSPPDPTFSKCEGVEKRVVATKHPHKADIWSFGIMSSEILTGDIPFSEYREETTLSELLERMIQENVRPRLPDDCPGYLRLYIERCWKLDPLERPKFTDVWRMLRIAKLWSVGLILNDNLDWFLDKNWPSQVVAVSPAPVVENVSAAVNSDETTVVIPGHEGQQKKNQIGKRIFSSLMLAFSKFKIFGRPEKVKPDQGIHYRSSHKHPFGYIVGKVWPQKKVATWKLDVIFFEGNVGGRQRLSCRDTWLQRDVPKVFWPEDWLPQDVHDKKIRVLVLEYDISETGLEGLVTEIKKYLIMSDEWSQDGTWKSPIVLVGHSLGCTVIEALVLDLEKTQRQSYTDASGGSSSSYDDMKKSIDTARAFMWSLRGCFFYAYPSNGLVKSDSFVEVFGGLNKPENLSAAEFQEGSWKMLDRSSAFLNLAKHRNPQIRLMSLVEGCPTGEEFVVQRLHTPEYDLSIENTLVLDDSNHIQLCKPVDRQHPSYVELVKFLKLNSYLVKPPKKFDPSVSYGRTEEAELALVLS